MWRTLKSGMSDGPDIRQLEQRLATLGYFTGAPDAHFDAATKAAIRRWQGACKVGGDRDDPARTGRFRLRRRARRADRGTPRRPGRGGYGRAETVEPPQGRFRPAQEREPGRGQGGR
ncbi:peptidoglycan-binding domain-containing protein [Actinoallomurus sp. NPDC050550]|uniref:peptidoglycan-binding domain-containing protein n=1 Tax=Actinoallomurus sp. NPDC050550 TaxID=3154937 RepID=UPI0033EB1271